MTKIFMIKRLGALRPDDQDGIDAVNKIAEGSIVSVDVVVPRNEGHLRKYWKLMSVVHAAQPSALFATKEDVSDEIKIALGYCDMKTRPGGGEWFKPRSISFAKMDQSEFDLFYAGMIKLVCESILPGVTEYNLRCEIEELMG